MLTTTSVTPSSLLKFVNSMAKMHFDRWTIARSPSLAYRLFKEHHTQLNDLYFSHIAAFRGAFASTKTQSKADSVHTVFPDDKNERHREITLETWAKHYNEFDNWIRLSAVVAITGFLEVFIQSAVEAACQSCPGILIGGNKEIDGVTLLKKRPKYAFLPQSMSCVKGTWDQRMDSYEQLFGECPKYVKDNLAALDEMRRLRNAVGHTFGRSNDPPRIGRDVKIEPFRSVKGDKLKSYLDLAMKSAKAIDAHLTGGFIGCYETIAMYHFWADRGKYKGKASKESLPFIKYLDSTEHPHLSYEYCVKLINHYILQ
ncbi:MAG: hypothetical protein JWN70_575 [Planctomycetaceae bacterium]|nr:hypothetical protein [Planctomycetaceae bacterium]